jgi:hypothetical protein
MVELIEDDEDEVILEGKPLGEKDPAKRVEFQILLLTCCSHDQQAWRSLKTIQR